MWQSVNKALQCGAKQWRRWRKVCGGNSSPQPAHCRIISRDPFFLCFQSFFVCFQFSFVCLFSVFLCLLVFSFCMFVFDSCHLCPDFHLWYFTALNQSCQILLKSGASLAIIFLTPRGQDFRKSDEKAPGLRCGNMRQWSRQNISHTTYIYTRCQVFMSN